MLQIIFNCYLIMFILTYNQIEGQIAATEMCFNDKGEFVKQGEQYFPLGSDICTQCTCLNGRPEMCISVLCSPPEKCRQYHAVSDKCCEFVCLDGDFTAQNNGMKVFNTTIIRGNGDNRGHGSVTTNNLGLRLIASTITSFLILALLLFMIHRLRQRRLLLMIRRLQTRRLEQVNGLSADNSNLGYFSAHDQYDFGGSFNEPPPPYTFWKPPEQFIPPGEAPPPYDDSVGITVVPVVQCFDMMANHTVNRVNITGNCIVGSPTPFQQTQMLSSGTHPTICSGGQPFMTTQLTGLTSMSPIIDTISSDNCYEHITVLRINDSLNNQNIVNNCNNNIEVNAVDPIDDTLVVENNNTFSDSTSTSSIASSESSSDAFNSPSNCSVNSSSSQSTPTQSTVRRIESDNNSRL